MRTHRFLTDKHGEIQVNWLEISIDPLLFRVTVIGPSGNTLRAFVVDIFGERVIDGCS